MKTTFTGRSKSIPAGLAVGAATALGITIAGAAAIAKMVGEEIIGEENIGYGIMIMLLIASCVGAAVSYENIKRRKLLTVMLSGGIYWTVLLVITALFFGGQYTAVPETALLIICGSLLALLFMNTVKMRAGKRKIKIPNR